MPKLVHIDLSPVVAGILKAAPKAGDRKVIERQLGAVAMQFWKRQAQQNLRSTSRDYVAGLQFIEDEQGIRIELLGMLPNMVEQGWPGGDLRDWLLKGPNSKEGADGRYNTVPFRHGIPGTGGRNVGAAMPQPLHGPAKRLTPTLSRPGMLHGKQGGQHVAYGTRLHPDMPRLRKQAKEILQTKQRPWHHSSIYVGMIRKEKTYKAATQSSYMTFRRISTHSRGAKHWHHPGIKPRNFARKVQKHVGEVAKQIVAQSVGK